MRKLSKLFLFGLSIFIMTSCSIVNTNFDSNFDDDGYATYINTDSVSHFIIQKPNLIKFYVESSGSMNGFFRSLEPTDFQTDIWDVISYYSNCTNGINVITDSDGGCFSLSLSEFQRQMNSGSFGKSPNSTNMKSMIASIIDELDVENGEVAVLISDMKFDPVGSIAPAKQVKQYRTDISKMLGNYGYAVSLICATSDFRDKSGKIITDRSPYYYLILGNGPCVADLRNGISTMLQQSHHFVDNIESGFNYGRADFSFGITNKCEQLDSEPTFISFEDEDFEDTCTIKLNIPLHNYRWILSEKRYFDKAFHAICKYGSEIRVASTNIDVSNITNQELERTAIATVELKVFHMATDSEVIEWNLELPDTDITLFSEFFEDADNPNDPTKSFSVEDFCRGMFQASIPNKPLQPNYILISKKN